MFFTIIDKHTAATYNLFGMQYVCKHLYSHSLMFLWTVCEIADEIQPLLGLSRHKRTCHKVVTLNLGNRANLYVFTKHSRNANALQTMSSQNQTRHTNLKKLVWQRLGLAPSCFICFPWNPCTCKPCKLHRATSDGSFKVISIFGTSFFWIQYPITHWQSPNDTYKKHNPSTTWKMFGGQHQSTTD